MAGIVWLSAEAPDRWGGGGQRRQFHQIRALVERGIDVHAVVLESAQSDGTLRELVRVDRFRARRGFRGGLDPRLLADAKGAIVAHVESLRHAREAVHRAAIPVAVDFHNVYSRWYETRNEMREAARWRRLERQAMATAERSFACSEEEASALRALDPGARVEVAGHGISLTEWPETRHEREQTVAVFGSWHHRPNREGAEWLAKEIWPLVAADVPHARLVLLGPGYVPYLPVAQQLGRVESLAEVLGRALLVAVPIRVGVGARVKFAEALASGAAVVSTSVGAEGFDADGAFRRADDTAAFAHACVDLLKAPTRARELGARGRELALTRLTWEQTSARLIQWVEKVAA